MPDLFPNQKCDQPGWVCGANFRKTHSLQQIQSHWRTFCWRIKTKFIGTQVSVFQVNSQGNLTFAQYGFAYQQNLNMAYIGGSEAHGAKLGATDDTDWYGLYIPPHEKILGLDCEEHFVFTSGGQVGGNGPQDVDVCLYTLMKWAGSLQKEILRPFIFYSRRRSLRPRLGNKSLNVLNFFSPSATLNRFSALRTTR